MGYNTSDDDMVANVDGATPNSTSGSRKYIWVITGPAGCGKTSVAEHLHSTFGFPYLEGDMFHTAENVSKMAHGHALTDGDRWDWLIRLREAALAVLTHGTSPSSLVDESSPPTDVSDPTTAHDENIRSPPEQGKPSTERPPPPSNVILTCSALKRKYRDVLRFAAGENQNVVVKFLFLDLPEDVLVQRVHARKGHYMKEDMVRSQLASLEIPKPEEEGDVLFVDAGASPEDVNNAAAKAVEEAISNSS